MDLNLPSILTDAQVATFAATIALLVGILQQISFIPLPDGSKARAWAVALIAAAFVALSAPGAGLSGSNLLLGIVLSFAALASAALGINRAGSFTAKSIAARAAGPAVADYDPKATGDEGAQG